MLSDCITAYCCDVNRSAIISVVVHTMSNSKVRFLATAYSLASFIHFFVKCPQRLCLPFFCQLLCNFFTKLDIFHFIVVDYAAFLFFIRVLSTVDLPTLNMCKCLKLDVWLLRNTSLGKFQAARSLRLKEQLILFFFSTFRECLLVPKRRSILRRRTFITERNLLFLFVLFNIVVVAFLLPVVVPVLKSPSPLVRCFGWAYFSRKCSVSISVHSLLNNVFIDFGEVRIGVNLTFGD